MDSIEKLIKKLKENVLAFKENIADFKIMLEWDPKDPELQADLAFLEDELNNYKSYLESIEKMELAVIQKGVYASKDVDLNEEYRLLREKIDVYIIKINQRIAMDMAIQDNVFEQTELLVDAIGIKIKKAGKLKGYVLDKMFGKGKDYIASLLPYGKQVIEVVTLISKTDPPKAPELELYEKAAIRDRVLNNILNKYEYCDKIKDYLLEWAKSLNKDESIGTKDKVVLMRGMREWLLESIGASKAKDFKKMIKRWRLQSVKELFATANLEISQVCESNEFGEIFNDEVYKTKFSNHKDSNQHILVGLIDVGLTVLAGVISTEELKEYFPTCKIVFKAREVKALDEQMKDNYMDEPPSSTYAKALARRREKEDQDRKERLEELKRIKNKKYIEVY